MKAAITACTLVTAIGRGLHATAVALRERRGGLAHRAFPGTALDTWTGVVAGLDDVTLPQRLARFDCRSNRLAELGLAQDGFGEAVRSAAARVGARRVGVFLGTSGAGMLETELAYVAAGSSGTSVEFRHGYRETMNLFSPARYLRERLGLDGPALVVSAACASSAKAFASGARALAAGVCDAALVGGVETLCLTTLHGFAALSLLSSRPCRPCDIERDGISLGEGAAFALLEPDVRGLPGMRLLGYGESADAHHLSTPHPAGVGAAEAMRAALAMADLAPADVGYVNMHGTGTRTNDAAEDAAITTVFGAGVPASSTKGWTGHTLGAAGAVEAVITLLALRDGFAPGTLGCASVDPALRAGILVDGCDAKLGVAATNSFGFGGSNCTLLFGTS